MVCMWQYDEGACVTLKLNMLDPPWPQSPCIKDRLLRFETFLVEK